jgi:hypothetical protein
MNLGSQPFLPEECRMEEAELQVAREIADRLGRFRPCHGRTGKSARTLHAASPSCRRVTAFLNVN